MQTATNLLVLGYQSDCQLLRKGRASLFVVTESLWLFDLTTLEVPARNCRRLL